MHEIKHDSYGVQVNNRGDRVRLFTRRGYGWSERYPRIVEAAKKIRGTFSISSRSSNPPLGLLNLSSAEASLAFSSETAR
jgi:hypothetical protein